MWWVSRGMAVAVGGRRLWHMKKVVLLACVLLVEPACSWPTRSSDTTASPPREKIQKDITFLSIVSDEATEAADTRLRRFLEIQIARSPEAESLPGVVRFPHQKMAYGEVIRAFVERDSSKPPYLARMTPYAYVAAEMLGAKPLQILATYKSAATKSTIYNSYFVVRKRDFQQRSNGERAIGDAPSESGASLEDLERHLMTLRDKPAKFIYHDRFSTSSYFLPSLYFRDHKIFDMRPTGNRELLPIQVERYPSTSSAALVTAVANADANADVAAIWDGTKAKFEGAKANLDKVNEQLNRLPEGSRIPEDLRQSQETYRKLSEVNEKVLFIKIPKALPNDFLVASGVNQVTRKLLIDGIKGCAKLRPRGRQSPAIPTTCPDSDNWDGDEESGPVTNSDDFAEWYAWDASQSDVQDRAREALAVLRQDARPRPTPVVVNVQPAPGASVRDEYLSAAREAVRLSGTEFVLYDRDLHQHVDATWLLESAHDHALTLTSKLEDFDWTSGPIPLSFVDQNDLPKRIADLVRSRLPRIRYVWPYEQKYPAVLRDIDFTPDRNVWVQRISWLDPTRNFYEQDTPFQAEIERNTDFSKFKLSDVIKFPRNADSTFNFEPMSNLAYRVLIQRQSDEQWVLMALPYCLIGLLGFACVGFVIDLRRRRPSPSGLRQTYQRLVEAYHRPWIEHEIEEREILWCDPASIDELVKKLRREGSFLDVVRSGGFDFNAGPIPVRFSILVRLATQLFAKRPLQLLETGEAGEVAALDGLMHVLLRRRRLSPFIGFPEPNGGPRPPAWPLEWEALNDITSRHFHEMGIGQKAIDATLGEQNGELSAVVSSHFRGVLKKGTHDASLFLQKWEIGEKAGEKGVQRCLIAEKKMTSALWFRTDDGPVDRVRLELSLPAGARLRRTSGPSLEAAVFGKLDYFVENGMLSLQINPIAILADHAHQH
jgi:ABC-type phosphate/phosphonate transport system substrate-binding protein